MHRQNIFQHLLKNLQSKEYIHHDSFLVARTSQWISPTNSRTSPETAPPIMGIAVSRGAGALIIIVFFPFRIWFRGQNVMILYTVMMHPRLSKAGGTDADVKRMDSQNNGLVNLLQLKGIMLLLHQFSNTTTWIATGSQCFSKIFPPSVLRDLEVYKLYRPKR